MSPVSACSTRPRNKIFFFQSKKVCKSGFTWTCYFSLELCNSENNCHSLLLCTNVGEHTVFKALLFNADLVLLTGLSPSPVDEKIVKRFPKNTLMNSAEVSVQMYLEFD